MLDQFASEFGLDRVEGKQTVAGTKTDWEIDAKGVRESDGGIMLVECRRYTKARLSQEQVGAIAYRIKDTGAFGAIVVTPLGLQEGAKKIAVAENMFEVKLDPSSTPQSFSAEFLGKFRAGGGMSLFIPGA
jgi:hypothetical protein